MLFLITGRGCPITKLNKLWSFPFCLLRTQPQGGEIRVFLWIFNMKIKDLESALSLLKLLSGEECGGSSSDSEGGKIEIVVLQRGWSAVGNLYRDGDEFRLENASVIRVWGTERGLGQIALEGPTSKTKLDYSGVMKFHSLTVVTSIECDQGKWNEKLNP